MLPYIVLSWVGIVISCIMVIYLPIDYYGSGTLKDMIINAYDFANEKEKEEFIQALGTIYGVMWTGFAIGAG